MRLNDLFKLCSCVKMGIIDVFFVKLPEDISTSEEIDANLKRNKSENLSKFVSDVAFELFSTI